MNKNYGFTIVELIVVIAIIAVLASIVLVNVVSFINKGKDASIKANINTIMANAAFFYGDNGSFAGFKGDGGYTIPEAKIESQGGAVTATCDAMDSSDCVSASTAFCISVVLNDDSIFCKDISGTIGDNTCVDGVCS